MQNQKNPEVSNHRRKVFAGSDSEAARRANWSELRWTDGRVSKITKKTKKHIFFRKCKFQKNPEVRKYRRCPPGAPRRPPGAPTGANCDGQMDTCQKSQKKQKKQRS